MKNILENPEQGDKVKVSKLSKNNKAVTFFPDKLLPDGCVYAELDKIKLFKEKINDGYAVFDSLGGLVLIQYQFWMIEGDESREISKTWAFYQKLSDALKTKYGKPTSNQITPIDFGTAVPKETYLATVWEDSVSGDRLRAIVTRHKFGVSFLTSTPYMVILEYAHRTWMERVQEDVLKEDL